MFGYVTIYKDELKIREYNIFRAYYCGLCKSIGTHSQAARMGLSYDMTFLSVLLSSVSSNPIKTQMKPCIAHPFHKRPNIICDQATEYSAHMSILLAYLKLYDDWCDEKSIPALLGMAAYKHSMNRSKRLYEATYHAISKQLAKLSALEKSCCDSIDETADCFAKILEILFTPDFVEDSYTRRCLSWLGYNTGRWIYIIDAFADLEKDYRKKNYNPFLSGFTGNTIDTLKEELSDKLDITLTFTLDNLASAYELLTIYKNNAILHNIIYLGLENKQNRILGKLTEGTGLENESL